MAKAKKSTRKRRPLLKLAVIIICGYMSIQFIRHPEQIVSFIGWSKKKTPTATWQAYHQDFKRHSTSIMTPSLLAAIAQTESSGDPLAVQNWKLRITDRIFRIFSPATTATGLMQFTEGTFKRAQKYCIHNGKFESKACLFNSFYSRLIPSDAIEVTAAYLHKEVAELVSRAKVRLEILEKQKLAAIIHLCGKNMAQKVLASNLNISGGLRCGHHRVSDYVNKVQRLRTRFAQL